MLMIFFYEFFRWLNNSLDKVDFPAFDKPVKINEGVALMFNFVKNYFKIYTRFPLCYIKII